MTFRTEAPLPRFKPSHFPHLALDDFDTTLSFWPAVRVFSIASAPSLDQVSIFYSAKVKYTVRMEKELAEDRSVWIKLSYEIFSTPSRAADIQEIVPVAGFTGLSSFIMFKEYLLQSPLGCLSPHLLYGVRRFLLLLAKHVLAQCLAGLPHFRDVSVESNEDFRETELPGPAFHEELITLSTVLSAAQAMSDTIFILSGPLPLLSLYRTGLLRDGFGAAKVLIADWD